MDVRLFEKVGLAALDSLLDALDCVIDEMRRMECDEGVLMNDAGYVRSMALRGMVHEALLNRLRKKYPV